MEGKVFHYHIIYLIEYSTEDDLKKANRKLALRYHPDKNKHPQASADFRMIKEAKKGFEYALRHNYVMRRTQERKEYLQLQEEAWR